MEKTTVHDITLWIGVFDKHCTQTAFLTCPQEVYGIVRGRGYVDAEHNVTPKGLRFVQTAKRIFSLRQN